LNTEKPFMKSLMKGGGRGLNKRDHWPSTCKGNSRLNEHPPVKGDRQKQQDMLYIHCEQTLRRHATHSDENVANRKVRDFGWEIAHEAVTRLPPRSVARTEGYTHDAKVWDLSIVQGPVSSPRAKP
jgi:hypothetical protein